MLEFDSIHHVSLPVSDLRRSKEFYSHILGLKEIVDPQFKRPDFEFEGAWYQVGDRPDRQLHLILDDEADKNPTFRTGKHLDSRDIHFAIRVTDFDQALTDLQNKGYRENNDEDEFKNLKINRPGPRKAPFRQIYLLDPDRHVIELNEAPRA